MFLLFARSTIYIIFQTLISALIFLDFTPYFIDFRADSPFRLDVQGLALTCH